MFKSKWVLPVTIATALGLSAIPQTTLQAQAKDATVQTVNYKTPYKTTLAYYYANNPKLAYGSAFADIATNLARANYGVNKAYYTNYYKEVEKTVAAKKGQLTESAGALAKIIISINAIGKDATKLAGYNAVDLLGDKLLADEKAGSIGISNAIYALMALNSKNLNYSDATKYQAVSKQALADYLVSTQFATGGFSWDATNEAGVSVDMTAMTLTALAPMKGDEKIDAAIDKVLAYIAAQVNADAGYAPYGSNNADTQAQVLVALTENGMNPQTATAFIKNKKWAVSNILLNYDTKLGGFKYMLSDKEINVYTTSSAVLGLTAYDRFASNKTKFYDLADVKESSLAIDSKAPTSVKVNTITNKTQTISGTTEAFATVAVYNGSKKLKTVKADFNGKYTVKLSAKLKATNTVKIYVTDLAGNKSKAFSYKVKDVLTSATPKVSKLVAGAKKVTGTTTKGATITVKIGKKSYKAIANKTTGKFSITVPKLKKATTVKVTAKKDAYTSKTTTLTVKNK